MKKYIYLLLSIFLLFTLNIAEAQNTKKSHVKEIKFFQGNLQDFETLLLDKGKPGFVFLYSDGQRESMAMNRMMEDQSVINYVDSNFLAYKVNVEENPQIALQYGIENVPCLILIDTFRRERDRLYTYRAPQDFRKFLNQVFE
ncbi:MAG: thioredoxin family protein [Bacteroidia bacterium]